MARGISLANKSQVLFGFAVVAILGAALAVPWFWSGSMADQSQMEAMRQSVDVWLRLQRESSGGIEGSALTSPPPPRSEAEGDDARFAYLPLAALRDIDAASADDRDETGAFLVRAFDILRQSEDLDDYMEHVSEDGGDLYRYARALRDRDLSEGSLTDPRGRERLVGLVLYERRSEFVDAQLLMARIYIVAAWLFASLLAILLFYFILTKLILSPVRRLKATADKVQAGNASIRADIRTGDEFEELSAAFNSMLERVAENERQLRRMNETLDLRLTELAEANFALYESNRLKGEFLASVSHELRTPLNSIIGFSELLDEMARTDPNADPKRSRYLSNILSSARSLLEMINDLLEMAKIEAGRVELAIEPVSPVDLIEGLQTIMKPQAQKRAIALEARVGLNLPAVETDPGKLQQILYNFLSNAIKFAPEGSAVIISAERLTRADEPPAVRFGVTDTGPGIPLDMQDIIFEKFRQVDASHTREHKGVGLGLAICRELAELLGASLSVVSEPGAGATFHVDVPIAHQSPAARPLMENTAAAARVAQPAP
jgi:signal transduction histidine kinase